jgi:hypothetical protein
MGVTAVGTTVVRIKPLKWHCHCMLENGKEVYIVIRAESSAEAGAKVHRDYKNVEYVLDTLTHNQMERLKRHLKPSLVGAVINY